jgi:hypothetical protein
MSIFDTFLRHVHFTSMCVYIYIYVYIYEREIIIIVIDMFCANEGA